MQEEIVEDLLATIHASIVRPTSFLLRGGIGMLLACLAFIVMAPFGQSLRARGRALLSRQAAPVLHYLLRVQMRGGIARSCISDFN